MALNKNQKKFFQEATSHFGATSRDVKYKDLVDFAKKNDLILPVSALKELCSIPETRGRYNLLNSGAVSYASASTQFVAPEPEDVDEDNDDDDNKDVIVETSAFVDQPKKSASTKSHSGLMFVVLNDDLFPVSLRKTIKGAYLDAKNLLGGNKGVTPIEEVAKHLKKADDATTVISTENGMQIYIHALEIQP